MVGAGDAYHTRDRSVLSREEVKVTEAKIKIGAMVFTITRSDACCSSVRVPDFRAGKEDCVGSS